MTKTVKVLLADDSELQVDFLESAMIDLGVTDNTKASNGAQAFDLFSKALQTESPYNLVFLDIVMPEMDGQEALKKMRMQEQAVGIPEHDKATIIMTTSLDSPEDMIQALIDGDCTDYIVKPVLTAMLKTMLTKYGFLES